MSIKNSDNTSSINVDEAFINYQLKIPVVSSLPSIGVNVGDLVYYNGEVYYRDSSQWIKFANGSPPTGAFWEVGGDTLTNDSVIGSLNNFDVIMQRNGIEYLRLDNNHMNASKNLDMGSNWVRSSHIPTSQTDLTNLKYTDDNYFNKNSGGNITGNSTFNSNLFVSGFTTLKGSTVINENLTVNSIVDCTSALTILRNKLGFIGNSDFNSSIYNNLQNIDGYGSFDGLKLNTYNGMKVSIGDFSVSQQTKFNLDNIGQIGINTISASARLDVVEQDSIDSLTARFVKDSYNPTANAWQGRIVTGIGSGTGTASSVFIAGNLNSEAHIGGHRSDLSEWRPLKINYGNVTQSSVFMCGTDTNARLGVGTQSPSTKLEVVGDIKCSGDYYDGNYMVKGAIFYARIIIGGGTASIDTNYINQGITVSYIGVGSSQVTLPITFSAGNYPIPQVSISEPSTITNLNISVNIISGSVYEINTFDNSGSPADRNYYIQFIATV